MDRLVPFDALRDRLRVGEPAAWDEFYRRYEPFLLRVARRWLTPSLRNQADSVDVVQSVIRTAMTGLPRADFANEAQFLAWLGTVTRHRVTRLSRRSKGPRGAPIEPLREHEDPKSPDLAPAESAVHAETLHCLKTMLDRLPPDEREAIFLHDFDGLEFAAVAGRMGRPSADAARKLHGRARARLASWIVPPDASGRRRPSALGRGGG